MKKIIKDISPVIVFSLCITAFVFIFTRFFTKMDDGNFLGIALSPDFSYENFLAYRYNNISGRTINEFLVMFFCRHNIIFWKAFISGLLIFIVCFFNKLSSYFNGDFSKQQRQIFCALSFFMMMVSCLNPSVFWFAGSFTFLFPFAGLCATALPFVKYIYEKRFSLPCFAAGVSGCVAACSQEQGSVCCIALIICFFVFIKIKKLSFRPAFLFNLIVSVGLTVHLFTSPGMSERIKAEASGFARFEQMKVAEKLFCGVSVFFANSFYLSVVLIIVLVSMLTVMIYSFTKNKACYKKLLVFANAICVFICLGVNALCCVMGKGLAHMIIRRDFISGDYSIETKILISCGFILLLEIIVLSVFLAIKKPETGIPVLLCLSVGFGCGLMMSFSSSIFASGQRVFFFTNMFVVSACIILLSSMPQNKFSNRAYRLAVFYAVGTVVADIFAFTFAEHPLMG